MSLNVCVNMASHLCVCVNTLCVCMCVCLADAIRASVVCVWCVLCVWCVCEHALRVYVCVLADAIRASVSSERFLSFFANLGTSWERSTVP